MMLNLNQLTGNDRDRRAYINTSMIAAVTTVAEDPGSTLILMIDGSKTFAKKPVEEVVEVLKEHDRELAV